MKQKLEQKLEQRLLPYQLIFMDLLETPILDIRQEIERLANENPMIEIEEQEESYDLEEPKLLGLDENSEDKNLKEEEGFEESQNDEPINLLETIQYYYDEESYYEDRDTDTDRRGIQYRAPISLYEHLIHQIQEYSLTEKQKAIAEYIIGNLNSNGYLYPPSLDEERKSRKLLPDVYSQAYLNGIIDRIRRELKMKEGIEASNEEIEEVLHIVQQLNPPGIGARNLLECLLIQLKQMPPDPIRDKTIQILSNDFSAFTKRDYARLMRKYHLSEEELTAIIHLVKKLNPKPASGFSSSPDQGKELYVMPELYLEYGENGEPEVRLRDEYIPRLRINHRYLERFEELVKKQKQGKKLTQREHDELTYLQKKIEHAKWIVEAIQMRQNTLLAIMKAIVEAQKPFFLNGEDPKRLRPLILEDIAQKVGRDISTVSRATRDKYLQTPHQIYPLRFFFTDKLKTTDGEAVSNTAVKEMIKEIIQNEDKREPYTDDQIVQLLKKKGINLARRTVAKYREQMNIPPARLRKELS